MNDQHTISLEELTRLIQRAPVVYNRVLRGLEAPITHDTQLPDLSNVVFANCTFVGDWGGRFRDCIFKQCRIDATFRAIVYFEQCTFDRTWLHGATASQAQFNDCDYGAKPDQMTPPDLTPPDWILDEFGYAVEIDSHFHMDYDDMRQYDDSYYAPLQPFERAELELTNEPDDSPTEDDYDVEPDYPRTEFGSDSAVEDDEPDESPVEDDRLTTNLDASIKGFKPYLCEWLELLPRGNPDNNTFTYVYHVDEHTAIVAYSADVLRAAKFDDDAITRLKNARRFVPANGYFLWVYARFIPDHTRAGGKWEIHHVDYTNLPF